MHNNILYDSYKVSLMNNPVVCWVEREINSSKKFVKKKIKFLRSALAESGIMRAFFAECRFN